MEKIFICGINRSGTHLLFSLLSGHSQLFVTGIEDRVISGIAEHGDKFVAAVRNKRLDEFYRTFSFYTRDHLLGLNDYYQSLRFSHSGSYQSNIYIDFDCRQFEQKFLPRLCGSGRELTVPSVEGAIDIFYQCFAEYFYEEEKPFLVTKPCGSAAELLKAKRCFPKARPVILSLIRDPLVYLKRQFNAHVILFTVEGLALYGLLLLSCRIVKIDDVANYLKNGVRAIFHSNV